ncbi:uncharacterized protein LOC114309427 [Camellia sinensis]|uniref:uncharacterized protein LOC114309427 n=1 Tax=Camellia sinensis TaxID=4442 RepID=UPI001035F144|nr:uncharacterized protein LOC114309427 [Camellia sinensis]
MYPFERYMKILKGYVKNRARPEGCIAECYLVEECMQFCSGYTKKAAEIGARHNRNTEFESETILEGHPITSGKSIMIPDDVLQIAHRCVLINSAEVQPHIEMHAEELKRLDKRFLRDAALLHSRQMDTFCQWLKEKINSCGGEVSNTLKWLAVGPRNNAMPYLGYVINGHRFHTTNVERATQNSGVSIEAETFCRASKRDTTQVVSKISFYGVIKEIILLDYYKFQVRLFKCDWATTGNGAKVEDGFTLVNLQQGRHQFERDPFILASHAKQVFYLRDSDTSSWEVVLKAPPRGFHDFEMNDDDAYMPCGHVDIARLEMANSNEDECYVRTDCEGVEDITSWEVVLKAPPRGFHDFEMNDDDAYMPCGHVDIARLEMANSDEDECYVEFFSKDLVIEVANQQYVCRTKRHSKEQEAVVATTMDDRSNGPIRILGAVEIKDKLWDCVKLRYKMHDIHKTHVMQKFAKLWRNHKSELSRKVRTLAATGKGHLASNIALTKPDNIGMA